MQRITLLWKRFSPLELNLLAAVRTVVPAEAQEIFDAQVGEIGRVQRLPPAWAEISFYPRKGVRISARFQSLDEFPLAEVLFHVEGKRYRAKLSCINGRIFDFSIIPGAKKVAFSAWEGEPQVRLLEDPMTDSPAGRRPEPVLPVWRAVLERESRWANPEWVLHDEETAYRVTLDEGEYLVLAERKGDQFILQRLEPRSDQLFFLESHEGAPDVISGKVEAILGEGI